MPLSLDKVAELVLMLLAFPDCVGCPGNPHLGAGVTFVELMAVNSMGEEPCLPHHLEVAGLGEHEQQPGVLLGSERLACPCLLPLQVCTYF